VKALTIGGTVRPFTWCPLLISEKIVRSSASIKSPCHTYAHPFSHIISPAWRLLHACRLHAPAAFPEARRSKHTVVLDQILIFFPLLLVGGWQLSTTLL